MVSKCDQIIGSSVTGIWYPHTPSSIDMLAFRRHTLMAVGYETAVCSTTQQYGIWRGLVAVVGRSAVVRALAAQASDLGSIPGGYLVLFHVHSPFQPVYVVSTSD